MIKKTILAVCMMTVILVGSAIDAIPDGYLTVSIMAMGISAAGIAGVLATE